jgi:molecular chaperone DnaJ
MTTLPNTDLYAVLEVEASVSQDELRKSYRRLARQYHPDNNPDDAASEARFKEVSQAYEILSDPERRANYDRFGADVGAGGSPTPHSAADPSPVPTRKSRSTSRSTTRPSGHLTT